MRQKTSHAAIQSFLKSQLPGAQTEKNFTEIGRIADLVYFPQKIIYEIQCSSIELEEAIQRNKDYASIGFQVIWIFHDRHFNKSFVPPAELYLRKRGAYYTSFTPQGYGFFYDQLDFFDGALRIYKGKPIVLKNFFPKRISRIPFTYPRILKKRLRNSPLHLPGDLADTVNIKEAKALERTLNPQSLIKSALKRRWYNLLMNAADQDDLPGKHIPLGVESIKEYQEKVLD